MGSFETLISAFGRYNCQRTKAVYVYNMLPVYQTRTSTKTETNAPLNINVTGVLLVPYTRDVCGSSRRERGDSTRWIRLIHTDTAAYTANGRGGRLTGQWRGSPDTYGLNADRDRQDR